MGISDRECKKCGTAIRDATGNLIASIACMHRSVTESDWANDPESITGKSPRPGLAEEFECFCFRCYGQVVAADYGHKAACPVCGRMCMISNPGPFAKKGGP